MSFCPCLFYPPPLFSLVDMAVCDKADAERLATTTGFWKVSRRAKGSLKLASLISGLRLVVRALCMGCVLRRMLPDVDGWSRRPISMLRFLAGDDGCVYDLMIIRYITPRGSE